MIDKEYRFLSEEKNMFQIDCDYISHISVYTKTICVIYLYWEFYGM